jgi:hypothetical protein
MRGTLALLVGLPRRELSAEFDTALRDRLAGLRRPAEGVASGWAWMALLGSRPGSTERCLRAPWPSPVRRLAPAGVVAAAVLGVFLARPAPTPQKVSQARPVPVYVSVLVHEHQMLNAGADMNATVVGHNLNGDLLGDEE